MGIANGKDAAAGRRLINKFCIPQNRTAMKKRGADPIFINPEDDPRYRSYVQSYIDTAGRHGVTPDAARTVVRTNATVIAALAVIVVAVGAGGYLATHTARPHQRSDQDNAGGAPGRSSTPHVTPSASPTLPHPSGSLGDYAVAERR